MRPQKSCNQPHGTNARYLAGCSCFDCCEAHRIYVAAYKRGEVGGTVDLEPVQRHVARLKASGMPRRAIAEQAGVSYHTLRNIESGEFARVRSDIAEQIISVRRPMPSTSTCLIPAAPTLRLIRRCHDRGVSAEKLARHLGLQRRSLPQPDQTHVYARTALRIEDAARALGVLQPRVDFERYAMLRTFNGLSPEDAAECMGISARHACRIEAEQRGDVA